ncbi:MAG: long-chain fatty acid--CoA ligase [Acidobacteria bacterium]|nr:long-chain fatty acid--CoA ligase [Acidobacteriota bacterium]
MTGDWLNHYDYWVRPHLNYPQRPLHEILSTAAVEFGDRPATMFLGATLTFRELKIRADRLAAALARRGIAAGDRVGIMLPNCPQYIISAFAILRLGAMVVNVNPGYTPREALGIAADSGMRAIVTLVGLAPLALGLKHTSAVELVVLTSLEEYSAAPARAGRVDGAETLADLISDAPAGDLPPADIDPDQAAVLQYTSGTTGQPKGAMLTHANLFANVVQTATFMYASPPDEERYLLVIPLFHIYAFTVGMLKGLWIGASQMLMPKYDVEQTLAAIRDFRPTYVPAVPTVFLSLLAHPRVREFGLDRVRLFNTGGAPCPIELFARWEAATGRPLNQGYGLSEASPVTHSSPLLARRRPGTIGLPVPDTAMKIVDLDTGTRELPAGETGELCVAGPQVMKGYWNRPRETAAVLRADAAGRIWLRTGDIARVDADGFTTIVQRKDDLIIVDGFNVYPSEVEAVLAAHPEVRLAAAIGVPDRYHGEVVKAFVVAAPGASAAPEELVAHCRARLAAFKVPREIELRDSLPMNAAGKILYRDLRN